MSESLTPANKASLINAFELAAKKKLGQSITPEDILSVAKRTVVPAIASRIYTEIANSTEKQTFQTMARLAIGMCEMYAKRAGLTTGDQGTQMPIILGGYFINRVLNDSSSTIAQINAIDLPIEQKFAALFESFWSSLDIEALKEKMTPRSESAARVTFKTLKAQDVYKGTEQVSYAVNAGGRVCGKISWDKACGECSDKSTGWVVTLFDGFNEAAYRSGRGENAHEPFTAVHKGEVKLQNPSRMTLALAKSWARGALRG
ncbi:hypothetical protein MPK66_gp146 [Erwinia phage pEa_SNUABM_2]|uniref:Uncharacterized protein n=1 Tax=Erwinia phage pEa_SNUABM_2 TaxID=2869547 RepID=A0AAE7XPF9_9CAUD|nr:hypothetical protein MPK66_gp146 [Erwinia phage pEa_SNUABM_2]QZE59390.1 hypothetical protein pEaSNUABM2_00146 [Erwinia phage pEa_SNUABM_2]QZE59726.1 hypothetical protein pEaSNUABM39_00146 [Erwinia phage pEa_SNUABM_39]